MEQRFEFTKDAWSYNIARLTNQIFKMLPMYENGEDWEKQHTTLLLEMKGYNDLFKDNGQFLILVGKMQAIKHADDQFVFRKTIFETIAALKEIIE